jgi:hypothetical protein
MQTHLDPLLHYAHEAGGMKGEKRRCLELSCPAWFVQTSNGQKFCKPCAMKRKRLQNRRSQIAYEEKPQSELMDLTDAVIDQMFSDALAQIRRDKVHRLEDASFDYRNRYREP